MDIRGKSVVVTGGGSGLGLATAQKLASLGAKVTILDLPDSAGASIATDAADDMHFAAADVTSETEVEAALDSAEGRFGPVRALVHCAGLGGAVFVLNRRGEPGSQERFESIVRVNLFGTFNVLRLAAARMARAQDGEQERGVCVLTSSIAAYEGQSGQIPYASSKAGIVGMTLVAARDLASRRIRVCTIAPGVFATPILDRHPQDVLDQLAAAVPNPSRLGRADEFALLATQIIENPYLNGETIRLDGALRMSAG